MQSWCEQQARREAPYMPATALGTAIGFPIFTAIQDAFATSARDSSWPFCMFMTGLFLHLAARWGREYRGLWKPNDAIGRFAMWMCAPFWVGTIIYLTNC